MIFFKQSLIVIFLYGISLIAKGKNNAPPQKEKIFAPKFTEGIVYSRTSFPGHPLNDSFEQLGLAPIQHISF